MSFHMPNYVIRRDFLCASILLQFFLICISFVPPSSWDEIAYTIALPRDYAHENRFFYNADYGPYSAFPANYEALTTIVLYLTNDVWPM